MPTINKSSKPASWVARPKAHQQHAQDNQQFYNSTAWRTVSRGYRSQHPLCRICMDKGLVEAGTCVDHIVPINQGGARWDWANLQTLCHRCHARKSGAEAHNKHNT